MSGEQTATAGQSLRGRRKALTGTVTSDRMAKTIVVQVTRLVSHQKYGRVMRSSNSFKAHDERNEAHVGDLVRIVETRPISKDKRWRLEKIIERAPTTPPVPETTVGA